MLCNSCYEIITLVLSVLGLTERDESQCQKLDGHAEHLPKENVFFYDASGRRGDHNLNDSLWFFEYSDMQSVGKH